MRRLAATLRQSRSGEPLRWLDYGCGKGVFMEQIAPFGLFETIVGYDPAVDAYRSRPIGGFDLVTCLDVLDVTESRFQDAVIADVAKLTNRIAVFDCLTKPKPESLLPPHAPFYWAHRVRQHMDVLETRTEFPGMIGFERVILVCARRDMAGPSGNGQDAEDGA